MKLRSITVQSRTGPRGGGETVKALLAVCENCDNTSWSVFQIEGHQGFHLQCTSCDVSYCPGGECREDHEVTT